MEASSEDARLSAELSELRVQSARTQEELDAVLSWALQQMRDGSGKQKASSVEVSCRSVSRTSLPRWTGLLHCRRRCRPLRKQLFEPCGRGPRLGVGAMHIRLEGLQRQNKDLELTSRCE